MEEKSLAHLFEDSYHIKKINFIKFNRTNFTDYSYMFYYWEKLNNLDISKLKTDNVETMAYMFTYCKNLKKINISKFKTDKLRNIVLCSLDVVH